jgi:amino acid adenylation domain-containing protein/non-ribosomal peptide synthase protein (TIGR01720 family)
MSQPKKRNVEAIYALSPMQQGMLFHSLYDPEESMYVVQFACTLSGKVNPEALQQAWQEVVNRHSVLRTFFVWQDLKEPVQIVRQHVALPWLSLDWRSLSPDIQQQQLSEFLAADHARGFDLRLAPLMRFALIRLDAETYHFVWSFHHLLLDGWSTPLVIKEVFTFYEGLSAGQAVELGAVRPYREYIRWLRGQEMGAAEQFWREMLKGFTTPTTLGIERSVEGQEGSEAAQERYVEHQVSLTAEQTAELQRLARQEQVTLNTVVQGAWALLLSRYSGNDDVVFGATVSGRPASLPGVEEMVGLFINTLPVRVEVKHEEGVGGYLRRLQEQQVEVRQYEYSPLVEVQAWSEVPKGMALFETLIAFENYPLGEALGERSSGLEVSDITNTERNSYPLALVAIPAQELTLKVIYDSRRYDAKTITRMMEHLQALLQSIAEQPSAPLTQLSLLTEAERRHLLLDWNHTAAPFPLASCIHHLFEAQAQRSPHAIAAHLSSTAHSPAHSALTSLTFVQLDERANQLSHFLLDSGIGPHSVVALLLDHSCETLIAILGVLKAGCAYLPLDPSHPPARMAFALADAQAALLITTHSLHERLGANIAAHLPTLHAADDAPSPSTSMSALPPVLSLDTEWQRCASLSIVAPAIPPLSSASAAYLIYTSGSTGVPKGVVIEHASLVNYICWAQSVYLADSPNGDTSADCAFYSSLAFDLTVTSLFLPLVSGHTIHLYPQHDAAPSLLEVMADNRVHLLKLTPSHLSLIRDLDNRNSHIRRLIVGGEALSTELAQAVSRSFGHRVEIYNEYGPTEATVGCMLYRYEAEVDRRAWVPIGRPAANTQIYILDEQLEPTAEHVTGELYIGGAGVARGYLGRAELTAGRFVPDPFSERAGARLYRTGDRARRLADGTVEYLGRNDEQVKYHGYRVELNELRLALSAHPRVRDAVVVVRRDGAGGREQLVGYYVGREAIDAEELRAHMQERVIAETVPQRYVHLRRLPLTLNGKVNVEALPAPWDEETGEGSERGGKGAGGKEGTGEARTSAEAQLVEIWREVLGRERVRIDDNFFELGGDSILSIQIIARANRAGLHLMPRQLFQHPTVAGLAAVAGTAQGTQSEQGEVSGEAPLTPIQRWFFAQELAVPAHYNQSLLLKAQRRLKADALKAAVRGVLRQHDALRLRFERGAEGEWRQWHAPLSEELVDQACTVIDLSGVGAEELGATITAAAEEVQRSLDLRQGPMVRVVWMETGAGRSGAAQEGRLLIVAHHLVIDGVSWRVLLEDLERGYEQAERGQAVELGAKTASYREWAEALVAEAERGLGAAEEQYWTEVARAEVAQIPGGTTAGGGTVGAARRVEVGLSAERTRELLQEVPAAYNTQINDVLVTALARTLCWWTENAYSNGREAIEGTRRGAAVLVEMEGHGREEVGEGAGQAVDVSRTVGWFTSIYPVALEGPAEEDMGAALKRVKEQLRRVPRRGLGYGVLRYLGDREVSARLQEMQPAQVGFNYLGQLDRVVGEERWLAVSEESAGAEREGSGHRVHAVEVSGYVVGGELRMGWEYDGERYEREEMEGVAGRYKRELEELIAHCVREDAGGFTPSDFPLADLSQPALDRIAANHELISDIYTLAPLQNGLLFHSLYTPSSGEYFVQLTCTLSGNVNPEALQQAWQEVVNRHSVLRTFFVWQDLKEPVQIVRQHVALPWLSLDWRSLSPDIQQQQLSEFLAADLARGFDLQLAPLMRLALIRVSAETYHFVWSFHHLLLDGWSTPLVIKEVFTFYEGLSAGQAVELGAVRPYREYIRWLRGQEMGAAEQFWREMLKGFTTPTVLGIERGVSAGEEVEEQYEGQEVRLTAETTGELQRLAREQQVTLNTVVQGAWALLLSGYSGSRDVVFGATVSGRPASLPGVEEMVGLFINTLPVRVQMDGEEAVGGYLRRLQEQQVEVRQYEYSPLVEVQGWSEVGRGVRLFDTILVFENYPVGEALGEREGGLEVRNVHTVERHNYPLGLTVLPGREMVLRLEYNTRRYEPASITRMLRHMLIVLGGMSARPEPRIADVPLLTTTERQQILFEWNETHREYGAAETLHQLFAAQAERSGEAVAVVYEGVELSYEELNRRSNQLAHYLQGAGVRGESVVAVLMERSVEMVVALLGILKAGGAYLPLDPAYPQERLRFMVRDGGAKVVLTQGHVWRGQQQDPTGGVERVLRIDEQWDEVATQSAQAVHSGVDGAHLAYVIYTSGSTGTPKGAMNSHRAICNRLLWMQEAYQLRPDDRVLQKTPFSFDVSVWEFFWPLLTGSRLVMARPGGHLDNAYLIETIRAQRITTLHFVPSMLHAFLEEAEAGTCRSLRRVICSGETLSAALQQRFFARVDNCELHNLYGPTEAAVDVTYWKCRAEDESRSVPIGKPIANLHIYLLDGGGQPVPVGVSGELHIGGVGVGRGYLQRPELTAERFIPDPFSGAAGARLYRSGDLARHLADGNIEFVGRLDHQIKVRGLRIELGEIESVLSSHPEIRESVVVVQQERAEDQRLVAYIVGEPSLTSRELRGYLRERLPEYMVPQVYVVLAALPLTANGKVDRRALPRAESLGEAGAEYVAPRNEVEGAITDIWQSVLGVERVGIHDNFFDLGGHSMLMIQVHNKLRERLKFEVSMVELFEYPSINALAEHLSSQKNVTSIQEQQDELAAKLREGRNRLRQQRRTRV